MTQRWGKDQEERSAVAQKAQDAYAVARQAMSKVEAVTAKMEQMEIENAELRRDLVSLQRQFLDATETPARPVKQKRAA